MIIKLMQSFLSSKEKEYIIIQSLNYCKDNQQKKRYYIMNGARKNGWRKSSGYVRRIF
jgi:hypothetical protein